MNPNKTLWEKGDFTRIAETMRESGEDIVRHAGIMPGMKVLDLGCGDGTTAIPAAKLGAHVLGVDIAGNLVAAGNRRAAQAGLSATCRFLEGDACDLGSIENKSFDRVISIFGAMFAPKPFDVAREMVRVTKPGGRIVMGNWIPNDPTLVAQILKISASYSPPPPEGFVSPMTWGSTTHVIERFGAAGIAYEGITFERDQLSVRLQGVTGGVRRHVPAVLRAHDECLRRGRQGGARGCAAQRAGDAVRKPEPEPVPEHGVDPRDVPAGDGGRGLTGKAGHAPSASGPFSAATAGHRRARLRLSAPK